MNSETLRWFTHWDCYPSPYWMVQLCYLIVMLSSIFNTIILIWSTHQFCIGYNKMDSFIKKRRTQILYISINIMYVMGPIGYLLAFSFQMSCVFKGENGFSIFYYMMVISAAINVYGNLFLYLFFVVRWANLFHNNEQLKLHTYQYCVFLIGFCVSCLCQFMSVYYYSNFKDGPWHDAIRWSYAQSISYIVFSLVLLTTFYSKMRQLIKENARNNKQSNEDPMMKFSKRVLVLSSFALITSNINILINIYRDQVADGITVMMVQNIFNVIDTSVNSLCLALQFPFAINLYYCLCGCSIIDNQRVVYSNAPESGTRSGPLQLQQTITTFTLSQ